MISKKISPEAQREILLFLIKLASIYLVWRLFSYAIGYQSQPIEERIWPWLSIKWEHFNDLFRIALLKAGNLLLRGLGYESLIYGDYILYVKGHPGVGVGNYCLGIQLMVLFVALIVSIKTSLKIKLLFIPLGLVVIQLLNILRIVGITIVLVYFPEYVNYSHDYIFNFSVLGIIILMYYKILNFKSS